MMMQSELRTACEALLSITQSPPEKDHCHPFGFGAFGLHASSHRCLSQAEANVKLRVIERLTQQHIAQLLANGWERLSPTQLLDVKNILLSQEAGERKQPLGDQAPAWCRLDEQLFRLAFTAWIKGTNFAVTPRPHKLAYQIGIDSADYKGCLQELRVALTRHAIPSARWPPRVSLWLGDPPLDEAGPTMPRLWVSARALRLTDADADEHGLLPANTQAQEHHARRRLGLRWSQREDGCDSTESTGALQQYTICCRCSQTLAV